METTTAPTRLSLPFSSTSSFQSSLRRHSSSFSLTVLLNVAFNRTHLWPRDCKAGAGTTYHTERLHRTARSSGNIQNKSQELKLEQVRSHLQIARFQLDRTGDLCKQLLDHGSSLQPPATEEEEESKEVTKVSLTASAPVMFASNPPTQSVIDPRKTEAAAMVAKLTASTSSAEMLSYVLSSFASEGIIGNNPPAVTETPPSDGYPPEKRTKLQKLDQSYLQQNPATTSTATTNPQPLPPPPPPPPPPQFQLQPQFLQPLQPPVPVNSTPFSYSIATNSSSSMTHVTR
ncbi:hypothetical protein N665_0058s0127 [Sinapis alba]|nr:hypothetical protein N665_0058s0127 [Sinapis alba]